jgi:hypothetical protein
MLIFTLAWYHVIDTGRTLSMTRSLPHFEDAGVILLAMRKGEDYQSHPGP